MNKTLTHTTKLKQQTLDAYDWLAKSYSDNWSKHIDGELTRQFLDLIPKNATFLDVGCGPGQYTKFFTEQGHNVIGVDLSAMMLIEAKKVSGITSLARMDMWNLGFPTETFDALWVCASFPHVPENEAVRVLSELRRVIKTQGILFLGIILGEAPVRIESKEEMGKYDREGRFFQWYRNQLQFEPYLEKTGFKIIKTIPRIIHSNVVKDAIFKTNTWLNLYCSANSVPAPVSM